jgi:hypothetical protein
MECRESKAKVYRADLTKAEREAGGPLYAGKGGVTGISLPE